MYSETEIKREREREREREGEEERRREGEGGKEKQRPNTRTIWRFSCRARPDVCKYVQIPSMKSWCCAASQAPAGGRELLLAGASTRLEHVHNNRYAIKKQATHPLPIATRGFAMGNIVCQIHEIDLGMEPTEPRMGWESISLPSFWQALVWDLTLVITKHNCS